MEGDRVAALAGEAAPILAAARRMAATEAGAEVGALPHETMTWLVALSRHPVFLPPGTMLPADPAVLAARLRALAARAAPGAEAALLPAALPLLLPAHGRTARCPFAELAGPAPGGAACPDLCAAALAVMLGTPLAGAPPPGAAGALRRALHAASAALPGEVPGNVPRGAPGARFLLLTAELGLALRLGAELAWRAGLLRRLAALAAEGAAARQAVLPASTAQQARLRSLLEDPATAMRLHAVVPHRSLAAGEGGSLRKRFAGDDAPAARAREALWRAGEGAARLAEEAALLAGLAQALREAAGRLAPCPGPAGEHRG